MRKPGYPKGKPRRKEQPTLSVRSAVKSLQAEYENQLTQVLELVKKTDARSLVLFQKVHNLQVSFDTLAKEYDGLLAILKELMSRPDEMTHAEHIVADFLRRKYGKGAS